MLELPAALVRRPGRIDLSGMLDVSITGLPSRHKAEGKPGAA
jgi:hypothetical protein